jgi:PAS domain S-box-containing protein
MSLNAQISRQIVQELYEIAPCGFLSTLHDGTIVKANRTFLDWTGYSLEEVLAKKFQDLLSVPGKIFYETQLAPLLQLQGIVKEVAFELVRSNQEPLAVLVNSVQRQPEAGGEVLIHSAFFDATDRRKYEQQLLIARRRLEAEALDRTGELEREIAERKRVEANLRELTGRLLQLKDDEQRRLARELHDSVGQLLVALSMNQSEMLNDPQIPSAMAELLKENASFVSQLSAEIRTISHLLHPPLLDEVGLGAGLRGFVEGFCDRSKIAVELEISPNLPRFQPDLETAIFRIVQECLSNIYRHSGSDKAVVSLLTDSSGIRLEVRDFGTGTAPQTTRNLQSGVGLRGMEQRVRQLRGTFEITSAEPGVRMVATFPLRKQGSETSRA